MDKVIKMAISIVIIAVTVIVTKYLEEHVITETASKRLDRLIISALTIISVSGIYFFYNLITLVLNVIF